MKCIVGSANLLDLRANTVRPYELHSFVILSAEKNLKQSEVNLTDV